MHIQSLPAVDSQFKNKSGDVFVVIGRGTRGIVIEYIDGRVELVSASKWGNMTSANFRTDH
ncbi:MAG: hypothetical protein OEM38_11215 [Gammaproteobacteria bacterium]|nr:hypothetical protein [Gammaproteobacteria bacterium]